MATRPIYQANLFFNYYSTKSARPKVFSGKAKTFITTENIDELNSDEMVISRINKTIKKNKDVKIKITKIEILDQYGETTDRF
jgi:hypothetical protein